MYKNSVRTSQETRYVTTTNPNPLILFREQSRFTVRTIRNTQIHYVQRMGCCSVLKHVENIITTRSNGLRSHPRNTITIYGIPSRANQSLPNTLTQTNIKSGFVEKNNMAV
jgi:hypothetical protein